MIDYIRDGQAIYDRSFAIIRAEADLSRVPADLEKLAVRVIHASGMVDVVSDIAFSEGAGLAGKQALAKGAPILCDARMVAEGITRARLPADNPVICTLNDPSVPELAKKIGNTRSAAALDLWLPHLEGSIVAIGNAHQAPVFAVTSGTSAAVTDIGNAHQAPVFAATAGSGQVVVAIGNAHQAPVFSQAGAADLNLASR